MGLIGDYMTSHHRRCDDAFARARNLAAASDWVGLSRDGEAFLREIERHIEVEEEILFPAFEERTGMSSGPTEVMRTEHEQMRVLFARMRAATEAKDGIEYASAAEAFLSLMQQHNAKEEDMMYPMLDQALGEDAREFVGTLDAATA
ncbi:MAG TPA: hemerythrin domain-containing protein [Casimicrobiaceae bacterium]